MPKKQQNFENPVWKFMELVADMIVLNFLFMFTSIPIVTIGASITALYTVTLKMHNGTEGSIFKTYFKAFGKNLKQAVPLWIIVLGILLFLLYDGFLAYSNPSLFSGFLMGVVILTGIIFCMWLSWVFPLMAYFENSLKQTIKNAALMMVIHLFPTTLLITVLNVAPFILFLFMTEAFLAILPLFVFFLFSAAAYNNSNLLKPIFEAYVPQTTEDSHDSENTAV